MESEHIILQKFDEIYCLKGGKASKKKDSDYDIIAKGFINDISVTSNVIYYIAPSPADHRANFSGSGIPFANINHAFENTPNVGSIATTNGYFSIPLMTPNSFMINLGTVRVPPTIYIKYTDVNNVVRIRPFTVSQGIPYRSMTYSPLRKNVHFYSTHCSLNVRSQEQILRESGYPSLNIMPKNHWGVKPPK